MLVVCIREGARGRRTSRDVILQQCYWWPVVLIVR